MDTVTGATLERHHMAEGIRVEVELEDPPGCTVAAATGAADAGTEWVRKAVDPGGETVVEEFATAAAAGDADLEDDLHPIFEYGEETVFRFERERDRGCPCEVVEAHGCPVLDIRTRGSDLYLTFHAASMDQLRATIQDLRDSVPSLSVQRLLRTATDAPSGSAVLVDPDVLTDRQREVIETAHELGYFDHPKRVNAGEVATALDISTSTFSEHLAAAQRKLLDAVLDT